jgi:eukaryotic translation initiation factor 2C
MRMQYPDIVALRIGKSAVIPMEICSIAEGQFYKKAIPADVTKEMVEFTKARPRERLRSIEQAMPLMDYDNSPVVRGSGMEISRSTLGVQGTEMAKPTLKFQHGQQVCIPPIGFA